MTDIRKRSGKKGVTYQARYTDKSKKSGHSYKTFHTLKEARAFAQNSASWPQRNNHEVQSVCQAVDMWLKICETEGTDGQEPVTRYTLKTYQRRAHIMQTYQWSKLLHDLTTPDIVKFRSWLAQNYSHYVASKALSSFHTVLKEMSLRGIIPSNVASGVSIRSISRYDEPVIIPTAEEVKSLLNAADRLANSPNKRIAKTWKRYRPILYLAVDSGMRPQEYLVLGKSDILEQGVLIDRALERGGYSITVPKTRAGRRVVDLSQRTMAILKEYIEHQSIENKNDLIFSTNSGHWLQVEHWRNRGFAIACIEAGLIKKTGDNPNVIRPKYTPYALRHFYASMLIHQNVDLKKIQRLMGHEKIETTLNIYGHLIEQASDSNKPKIGMLDRIGC